MARALAGDALDAHMRTTTQRLPQRTSSPPAEVPQRCYVNTPDSLDAYMSSRSPDYPTPRSSATSSSAGTPPPLPHCPSGAALKKTTSMASVGMPTHVPADQPAADPKKDSLMLLKRRIKSQRDVGATGYGTTFNGTFGAFANTRAGRAPPGGSPGESPDVTRPPPPPPPQPQPRAVATPPLASLPRSTPPKAAPVPLASETPKFCQECGKPLGPIARFCAECGHPVPQPTATGMGRRRSPEPAPPP
eukprot:EG_transcript_24411